MNAAVSIAPRQTDWGGAVSVAKDVASSVAILAFRRRSPKNYSLSAGSGGDALTTYSDIEDIVSAVSFEGSETEMRIKERFLVIPPHQADAYAEMAGYKNLEEGWDGVDSVAPLESTIQTALNFLAALPASVAPTEPGATADGCAEWYWRSEHGLATVSFFNKKMVYYARNADTSTSGTIDFNGLSIPSDLAMVLESL